MDMAESRTKARIQRKANRQAAPIDPERLLLKAHEVARRLGLARSTVYDMMASGEITTVRKGRAVRVPVSAIAKWIEGNTRPAA
jgi:excisionase family DNA binding protein